MVGMNFEHIINSIEDAYFGEEYIEQQRLVDSILSCRSLKDFRRLKIKFDSPPVKDIFSEANRTSSNIESKITPRYAFNVFQTVKNAKSACDFI